MDLDLAARYAPVIRFDRLEPFLPETAGVTVFRDAAPSPSFPRTIDPSSRGAALVIEYAIWWDWDITHLYELEHVWVYVGAAGDVVGVEASAHGGWNDMGVATELYSEPGKHAFAADQFSFRRDRRHRPTGVLVNEMFEGRIDRTPRADTLARTYLWSRAFEPAWEFDRVFRLERSHLVSWGALRTWIPARIRMWLDVMAREIAPRDYRFLKISTTPDADADLLYARSLDEVRGPAVYLELSDDTAAAAAAAALRERRIRAIVASRDPVTLRAYRALVPRARTSLILDDPEADAIVAAQQSAATFVHALWDPTSEFVSLAREAGLGIIASPADVEAVRDLGVDGVVLATPPQTRGGAPAPRP